MATPPRPGQPRYRPRMAAGGGMGEARHLADALRRLQESSAPILRTLLGAAGAGESTIMRG